ncbi:MAG TPA: hypothetical protein VG737_11145, partial [Cyclobacteriaceae bacterium]|nr:hypothetical protein [Cyclobacteriaceae bacterium]
MSRNNVNFGLLLCALAILGLGLLQIFNGEILAGRPISWPDGVPGKNVMAIGSGLLLIATGVSIVLRRIPLLAIITGVWILLWAASRNLFFILSNLDYGGMLTNTGKSLTLGAGTLLLASVMSPGKFNSNSLLGKLLKHSVTIARLFVGFFFLASGIQHFIFGEFVKGLVPGWIPGALFWTYFAGVALCATGISLLTNIKSQLAATLAGWMVFAWLLVLHLPRAAGAFNNLN